MRRVPAVALVGPPFPQQVNQHAQAVSRRSAEWAMEFGLISTSDAARRLNRANAADLASRACPRAEPDLLGLLTDLFTWLFAFDDSCDDDGLGADPARLSPVVAGLLEVLDALGGTVSVPVLTTTGPTGAALHDLCRRIRAQDRPGLLLRFTAQFREYLLALLWEAANREHHRVPGVGEYIQMRRHTGAVYPSFTLSDVVYGAAPGPDRLADPDLCRLNGLAADLVCWCNDIFSYDKERRLEQDGHNLTLAIAHETGQDDESALGEAARRFNTGLTAYTRLEATILAGDDPEVIRFATVRRCWIRGTYDWSMGASRYQ